MLMGWFGLIFLFILLSQSEGARNEPKELQLFGLAPHLFNPSNPAQRLMLKRNLENCHAPICKIAQKYFSSDLESLNQNSFSQRRAEVENGTVSGKKALEENTAATPESLKKCDDCRGPHCKCKYTHIPFPLRKLCELNSDSPVPDFMFSAICWVMEHEKSFRIITIEVANLAMDLLKLLPFGDSIRPDNLFPNSASNTPKPSNPFNTPAYPSPQNLPSYPQPPMSPSNIPNSPSYPQQPSIPILPNPPNYPSAPSQNHPNYPQSPVAPSYPSAPSHNQPFNPLKPSRQPAAPTAPNQNSHGLFSAFRPFFSHS